MASATIVDRGEVVLGHDNFALGVVFQPTCSSLVVSSGTLNRRLLLDSPSRAAVGHDRAEKLLLVLDLVQIRGRVQGADVASSHLLGSFFVLWDDVHVVILKLFVQG